MAVDLYRSFEEYVKAHHLIHTNDEVVIGVSGGADSVCLLLLLRQYQNSCPFGLTAVHVNHMIRGEEADRDEAFVKELCETLGVPCITKKVDVPRLARELGESEEEAGRRARYDAFLEAARAKEESEVRIAVAHHMDDNAETVLLNLIRGSGIKGLSGMQPESELHGCRIIRPLLAFSRSGIEAYLNEKGAAYCTDATNLDAGYTRNAVRLNVLTELGRLNSRATEHINASAMQLREIEEYLEEETDRLYEEVAGEEGLNIPKLKALPKVLAQRVVLKAIAAAAKSAKDITAVHVEDVLKLTGLQSGRKISLPYGIQARRQYDEILFEEQSGRDNNSVTEDGESGDSAADADEPEGAGRVFLRLPKEDPSLDRGFIYPLPGNREIKLQIIPVDDSNRAELTQKNIYTKCFDYDTIIGTINVGEKVQGDRIFLRSGMKTIKKFFIDEKIPYDERGKILLLKDDESVIWIIGSRISERHKITTGTKKALIVSVTERGKL